MVHLVRPQTRLLFPLWNLVPIHVDLLLLCLLDPRSPVSVPFLTQVSSVRESALLQMGLLPLTVALPWHVLHSGTVTSSLLVETRWSASTVFPTETICLLLSWAQIHISSPAAWAEGWTTRPVGAHHQLWGSELWLQSVNSTVHCSRALPWAQSSCSRSSGGVPWPAPPRAAQEASLPDVGINITL